MDDTVIDEALTRIGTPFYLFDLDQAAATVRTMRMLMPAGTDLCYAIKANPFLAAPLSMSVDRLEACSPGEFSICRRAGIPMDKVVMSGVYKSGQDIIDALTAHPDLLACTVESMSQWQAIADCAGRLGRPVRVLLRLTSGNQFGLTAEEVGRIIGQRRSEGRQIILQGIQYFSGTQKHDPKVSGDELAMLDGLLDGWRREYGYDAPLLEYGPGLPVDYFGRDPDVTRRCAAALASGLNRMNFKGRVCLEMGRVLAADCGYYATTIVDTKQRPDGHYAICDGGIHQLNYYGQMMAMHTPPVRHWDQDDGPETDWNLFGALCSVNDVLLRGQPFRGLRVGSRLIFAKAGAYSVTEGIALFLSRDLPAVATYAEGHGLRLVRGHQPTDPFNSGTEID